MPRTNSYNIIKTYKAIHPFLSLVSQTLLGVMTDISLDILTGVFIMFLTCINAMAVAAVLHANLVNNTEIPHDVFEEIIHDMIMQINVQPLLTKQSSNFEENSTKKKQCRIKYDHKHA